MPRIQKKPSLKGSAKALVKALAPEKLRKAKAIISYVKEVTPNDLIGMTKPSRNLVQRLKTNNTIKKLQIMEADGDINLNTPMYKLFKFKK